MAKGLQPREGETRQLEELDLEMLIERARVHDAKALGEIYRRYVGRVFGLCRYLLDSRESEEDAASEVFLKLQRSIDRYDGSVPFLSKIWVGAFLGHVLLKSSERPAWIGGWDFCWAW